MKIAIGADHRGFEHKEFIKQQLKDIDWQDVGTHNADRSDFPVFTTKVVEKIITNQVPFGVLLCGSGIGMSIAANRYSNIYAALVWNEKVARSATEHNNANVLIIPTDYVSNEQTVNFIKIWLSASFGNARYQQRIAMIDAIK